MKKLQAKSDILFFMKVWPPLLFIGWLITRLDNPHDALGLVLVLCLGVGGFALLAHAVAVVKLVWYGRRSLIGK